MCLIPRTLHYTAKILLRLSITSKLRKSPPATTSVCLFFLLCSGTASPALATTIKVAVSSNFSNAINRLRPLFEKQDEYKLVLSFASTGTLYAQILNGAPYDVFLSADTRRPRLLIDQGLALADSQFIYATGKLVLWSNKPDLVDSEGKILSAGDWSARGIRHIAMANPKTAPYGTAAIQTLTALGLSEAIEDYRVTGQNLAQTFQFIASENAQLGFVAYSQIVALPEAKRGSYWLVPDNLHRPIEQSALMLNKGRDNKGAQAFLGFLRSPEALKIIHSLGYSVATINAVDKDNADKLHPDLTK